MPTVSRLVYGLYVRSAARVPEEFIREKSARIDLAHQIGETPEMLATELELLYSLRRPGRTKTPRELAKSVMVVHDNTVRVLKAAK